MRATPFAMLGLLLAAAPAVASGGRLVVTDGRTGGGGVVLVLRQGAIDLGKGTGTDPAAIALVVDLQTGGTYGRLEAPAGAFDGTRGWRENDAARARYADRSAQAAGLGIARAVFAVGRRLRVTGGSPGDEFLDALGNGEAIHAAVSVLNGGESVERCVTFTASACRQRRSAHKTKTVCRAPAADAACEALPPACGNGVREAGEQCDGIPDCSPSCTLPALATASCCQGDGVCLGTPHFSLNYYVYSYCSAYAYPSYVLGGACDDGTGQCFVPTFPQPLALCCDTALGCYDGTMPVTDNAGLWWFRNQCTGSQDGTVYEGRCDASGLCVRD